MARRKNKDNVVGVVLGPILVLAALVTLWKNETRFDYHRAAVRTTELTDLAYAEDETLFSYTGAMDDSLTFSGLYVDSFTGYLVVDRSAQIYAWHESEDDEGRSEWDLQWMGSVESNSRNSGVNQLLKDGRMLPDSYDVGDLHVDGNQVEFVDSWQTISPTLLELSDKGRQTGLTIKNGRFYLSKNRFQNLGDERLTYQAIPVPTRATYFGKFRDGIGVADETNKRTGIINQLIQDTGILHHVVAGDRATALNTMKQHISRLKWIVRAIGSFCVVFGFFLTFANMAKFLFRIPVIGQIAEWGAIALALGIGLPLALLTILVAYLASHPLLLAGLLLLLVIVIVLVVYYRRQGQATREALRGTLAKKHGHEIERDEYKELEFLELARLAFSSRRGEEETKFLKNWASKQGWDAAKYDELIQRAKNDPSNRESERTTEIHLQNLIRLALADGTLSPYEMRTIRTTAQRVGYNQRELNELMDRVDRSREIRENFLNA